MTTETQRVPFDRDVYEAAAVKPKVFTQEGDEATLTNLHYFRPCYEVVGLVGDIDRSWTDKGVHTVGHNSLFDLFMEVPADPAPVRDESLAESQAKELAMEQQCDELRDDRDAVNSLLMKRDNEITRLKELCERHGNLRHEAWKYIQSRHHSTDPLGTNAQELRMEAALDALAVLDGNIEGGR